MTAATSSNVRQLGRGTRRVIGVGVAGLGRSGWSIHAEAIARVPDRFRLVAAMDSRPERRAEAEARLVGCRAYAEFDELIRDPRVDLVVVATPNHCHASQAIAAMEAGKDVLCEKPMACSEREAAEMIRASQATGRLLTVFHNRRFDPHLRKVVEVVESGVLGRIVQVRFTHHGFSRRWDWQTLREFGGGTLNNAGSHFLDQLLAFVPPGCRPEVFCHTDRVLTLGDAEDHCVVMLRTPGAPLVQMELTSACGYAQDNWLVMGTRGTLRGRFDRLEWRVATFTTPTPPRLEREPMPDRSYNADTVDWREFSWQPSPAESASHYTHVRFYDRLYASMTAGAPLAVTPAEVLRQMQVMDACRASVAAGMPTIAVSLPRSRTPGAGMQAAASEAATG